MQNNDDFSPEKYPLHNPENLGETTASEEWREAMASPDVPEFSDADLWLEESEINSNQNTDITDSAPEETGVTPEREDIREEQEEQVEQVIEENLPEADEPFTPENIMKEYVSFGYDLVKASSIVSFGFDTASRLYGLGSVLKALMDVDETDRDSENPLGAVYERIATTPEARRNLYHEINKDNARTEDANSDLTNQSLEVGISPAGDFYERNAVERRPDESLRASTEAIQAMKRLLEMLETSEIFAGLRKRAAEKGMTVLEYLIDDYDNPTVSDLLSRTGEEMTEEQVEKIINELTEQEEAITAEAEGEKL